ncbi:hypothetical protein PYCC9005_003343 [Savitreella phatthalungensis]
MADEYFSSRARPITIGSSHISAASPSTSSSAVQMPRTAPVTGGVSVDSLPGKHSRMTDVGGGLGLSHGKSPAIASPTTTTYATSPGMRYLSSSIRSNDSYAVYELGSHHRPRWAGVPSSSSSSSTGSADDYHQQHYLRPAPLIVSSSVQGFEWSKDVFISRYGQERYFSHETNASAANATGVADADGTHNSHIQAIDIYLDDDDRLFDDL